MFIEYLNKYVYCYVYIDEDEYNIILTEGAGR